MNKLDNIKQNIERKYLTKIPNSKGRVPMCFSIDKELTSELKNHCEKYGHYTSWVVEIAIKEYLERKLTQ